MKENDVFVLSDNWNLHREDLKNKKFFLFNINDGDIVRLNQVSYDILSSIDGEKSLKNIHDLIIKKYDVKSEQLWEDIFSLIDKCIKESSLIKCV